MRKIWLAVLLLAGATSVAAQDFRTLAKGSRIRVDAPDLGWKNLTATFESMDRDSLILTPDGSRQIVRVAPARITKLERSLGIHRRSPLAGIAIGAVAGPVVALGGLIVAGQFIGDDSESCTASDCDSNLDTAILFLGATVIGGAIVGGLVAARPRETWDRVSLRPTLNLERSNTSLGMIVRIPF